MRPLPRESRRDFLPVCVAGQRGACNRTFSRYAWRGRASTKPQARVSRQLSP